MPIMKLLPFLLLLLLPARVQAQFNFTTNNGTITITLYTGPGGAVVIPSSTNGLPVTAIGYAAFYNTSVTSISIPNSVTSIANEAFNHCFDLASVSIGSGVTNIGSYAFVYCFSLSTVYFQGNPPVVDSSVFSGYTGVTGFYMPGTSDWSSFALTTGLTMVLWNPQAQTGAGFGVQANQFGFNITGTANLVVVVVASTNLASPTWVPLTTNTLTGGNSYFSDPQWANYPRRFYRFRSP